VEAGIFEGGMWLCHKLTATFLDGMWLCYKVSQPHSISKGCLQ
jgi:hypothetical protein